MAQHIVSAPDGTQHIIEAPDDATPDQIVAYAQKAIPQQQGNDAGEAAAFVNGFDNIVPAGNKITSAMGALGAKAIGADGSVGDLYNQAQADTKATAQNNPRATLAGDAAGFVTSLPLAKPVTALVGKGLDAVPGIESAGAAIGDLVRGGKTAKEAAPLANAAVRAGQNAVMAAPVGAAYGLGNSTPGNRLHDTATGALLAGGGGAALSLAGDAIAGSLSRPLVTSDEIKKQAGMAYDTANYLGGVLKPEATNNFIDKVNALAPQTTKGQMMAGDSLLTKASNIINGFRDTHFTLQEAQEVDEHLSNMVDGTIDRLTGRPSKEGQQIMKVQDALRDTIMNANQEHIIGGQDGFDALQQGRDLWSKAAKLGDVERIISRAEMTDNPAGAIKTGFRTLYNSPSRMNGFSDEERAAIEKAATSGIVTDTLRTLGSRLIPIAAIKSGPAATMVANAGSTLSRTAATNVQLGKAANVARLIGQGAKFIPPDMNAPVDSGAMKLLSAPAPTYLGDSAGAVRLASNPDLENAEATRRQLESLGITPDIQKVITKNDLRQRLGPVWDQIDTANQQRIADEVNTAWSSQKPPPLDDLITKAKQDTLDLLSAKGNKPQLGAVGDALTRAIRSGGKFAGYNLKTPIRK